MELDPQETMIAEASVMNYLEDGIPFKSRKEDGNNNGKGVTDLLKNVDKRILSGGLSVMSQFYQQGLGKA